MYVYVSGNGYVCQRRPRRRLVRSILRLRAIPTSHRIIYDTNIGNLFLEKECLSIAYLSGGDDLKRAESGLEVGGVALKVVKSTSNAGLELAGLRARWAVGRDLVDGTHDCGLS